MAYEQAPAVDTPRAHTELSYAIRSAKAVVEALIARDQSAAEMAALRTCRDCDLLIRLIRDIAVVLQTNSFNQLTCSHAELQWLARRAAYVLTFVGAEAPPDHLIRSTAQDCPTLQQMNWRRTPSAPSSPTVAATGLRVRLVPIDRRNAAASPNDDRITNRDGSEAAAHPKPVEC